jgi:hypothetical protein
MLDFKKERKDLYQPKTIPSIIDVPKMTFIAIDGQGNPNTSAEYAAALEALYGLSYTIKMGNKDILEYVVAPLEGFWSSADEECIGSDGLFIINKDAFVWTALIRQPDFVTSEVFDNAKAALAKKKPNLDTSKARLEKLTEGLCVQAMHIGSYDDEPATVAMMDQFALESGYGLDINEHRHHHEIYLNDPRKVVPEKLKTIIRHPIKKRD